MSALPEKCDGCGAVCDHDWSDARVLGWIAVTTDKAPDCQAVLCPECAAGQQSEPPLGPWW